MEALTIEQQIAVLAYAKERQTTQFNMYSKSNGLCNDIRTAVGYNLCTTAQFMPLRELSKLIPLFTRENAIRYASAIPIWFEHSRPMVEELNDYWWPRDTIVDRLHFLDWIINQLKELQAAKAITIYQQIEVIRHARAALTKDVKYLQVSNGLCWYLRSGLIFHDLYEHCMLQYARPYDLLEIIVPLFTRENAVKYCGAQTTGAFWWPIEDHNSRLRFLNWMLKQLTIELNGNK